MGTTVFDPGGAAISCSNKSDMPVVQNVIQRGFTFRLLYTYLYPFANYGR